MKVSTKLTVLSCLGLFLFQSALAAETGGAKTTKTTQLEEITVTANKIEENLQDVPQSISVIDETMIDEKGLEDVPDIVEEIPNLNFSPNHGYAVNVRGINPSKFTNANPIVLSVDGVSTVDCYSYDTSLINVERVEVLRGPQGTLYGKDAIGGVINVVTKDPENAWHGKIGAEYGSYNFMRGYFGANGGLIDDTLYAGFSGQYRGSDGWIENIHNGISDDEAAADEHRSFNGYLLYTPTDRLGVRFTLNHDYANQDFMLGGMLPGGSLLGDFSRDDAETADFEMPTYEERKTFWQNLKVEYDFGSLTMTSITSHRKSEVEGEYDVDHSNTPLYTGLIQFGFQERDNFSEELRFTSNNREGIRWVGGLYVETEKHDKGPFGMQFPNFDMTTNTFLGNFEMNAESETDSNTYAAFGQVIIPFLQHFELTLGGRYQHIDKEMDLDMYYLPVGMRGMGPAMFTFSGDKSWEAFLPKAALSYKFNKAWTGWFSFSQGYMPGGFNYFAMGGSEDEISFEPQRSTNYEVGVKGEYKRLRLAASLFYMDIEDIHVYKSIGTMYVADNADSAHSLGAEMDFSYWLTESVELSGSAGVMQAEYDDCDLGGVVYDGERIENSPDYTVNLAIAWFHPAGIYSRLDMKRVGSVSYINEAIKTMEEEDGYTTVDARIGYRFGNWDIYVYARNLTDEAYVNSFISNPSFARAFFGEPRTFGVGVRYRF